MVAWGDGNHGSDELAPRGRQKRKARLGAIAPAVERAGKERRGRGAEDRDDPLRTHEALRGEAQVAGGHLRAPAGDGNDRDRARGRARQSRPLRKNRRGAHLRGRCDPAAAAQARDRAPEVSSLLGSQSRAAPCVGAEARGRRRFRFRGPDRVGVDGEVLRSLPLYRQERVRRRL